MTAVDSPFELGAVYRMRVLRSDDSGYNWDEQVFTKGHTHDRIVFRVVGLIYSSSEHVVPTEAKRDAFVKKEPTLDRIVTKPAVLDNRMPFTLHTRDSNSITVDIGWDYIGMPCLIEKATVEETKRCIDDIWGEWVHAEYVKRIKAEEVAKKWEKEAKKEAKREELKNKKVYEKCRWCGATTHPNAECLNEGEGDDD